jgi:hypothetical protein
MSSSATHMLCSNSNSNPRTFAHHGWIINRISGEVFDTGKLRKYLYMHRCYNFRAIESKTAQTENSET